MQLNVKTRLDILILAIRIVGLGYAVYNVMLFYVDPNGGVVAKDGDVYLHGIPMIKLFWSFVIIGVGSLIESIRNVLNKTKNNQPTTNM